MIRLAAYALLPLVLLVVLAACASLLSYGILLLTGDVLPLSKVVEKATLLLLLLSIFPLKKILQLSWSDLGFASPRLFFTQLGQGLLLGLVTLLPVLLMLVVLDVHVWDDSRSWTAAKFAGKAGLALFLALLIGIGEETLFRGLLLTSLRRKLGVFAAVVVSSLYFAVMHFLKSRTPIAYSEMTLTSGFRLMSEAFVNWWNPMTFSALLALFVVGLFLAILRSRVPQSLGLCIGCHAGWVWQIKVSKELLNVNLKSDYLYLVNIYYDGVVGPLVGGWLMVALLGIAVFNQRNRVAKSKAKERC